MRKMTVPELQDRYTTVLREATRSRNKANLIRRIAWRLQANEEGDLSERARRRAMELAAESVVRLSAPRHIPAPASERTRTAPISISPDNRLPMPGAIITREYKGETVTVHVLPDGFEYQGEIHQSLTAVVEAVTGKHWNGYHFFRLGQKGANGNGGKKE